MWQGYGISAMLSELVAAKLVCRTSIRELRMGESTSVVTGWHAFGGPLNININNNNYSRTAKSPTQSYWTRLRSRMLALFQKLKQIPQLAKCTLGWASTIEMDRDAGLAAMGGQMTFSDLYWMGVRPLGALAGPR